MTITQTTISIHLDDTVKENVFFHPVTAVSLNWAELFKHGIMMWEVPTGVVESDFDYLQSFVPAMELMLRDAVKLSADTIYNHSTDDRVKKLASEVVGVGIGLKYSTLLLNTNPNKFKKIRIPSEGKYLDYSTIVDSKEYEIETKGTVSGSYSRMKNDILEKKSDSALKPIHLRYGTISMIKNPGDTSKCQCVVVDDPPETIVAENDDTFRTQLLNYGMFLSYILDSKYYNRYIKPLRQNKLIRVKINEQKFFARYQFGNRTFYGECFDYRLIRSMIDSFRVDNAFPGNLLKMLTGKTGKTKFFIGLEESVITAINEKNEEFLRTYTLQPEFVDEKDLLSFLDKDGILIIRSTNGVDHQLESIFSDGEVEKRLGLYSNYIEGNAHQCRAPCTSKPILGKPCEKMTFRERCYFHR